MSYGKYFKTLNERAKELKIATDLPANNRGERRKELISIIKEERKKKKIRES
jgi:hypothetical protein